MRKVSVIMPAYNAEKYIKEAIDSILSQTFRDFEFIILNDCSRDTTEQIILSYRDDRIVYVKNEKNMGVAATLNRGLQLAKGEYVARMDADDISLPRRLEQQVRYLDAHPDIAVLGTNVETFDENGSIHTGWSSSDPVQTKIDLLFSCGLAHPSVMMRRNTILELGGYDLDFEGLEDYQLWCRVAENYGVTTLSEILLRYRVHSGQVTKNPSPEYLKRLRALHAGQLRQLGLPEEGPRAESYYRYCQRKPLEERQEVLALALFFENLLSANQQTGQFDHALLECTARSVLVTAASRLNRSDRKEICRGTYLVTSGNLWIYCVKRNLRRLLKR